MAFSDQGEKFGPVCTVYFSTGVRVEKKIEFALSDMPSPNIPYIKYITRSFELSADGSGGSCIYESIGILNR